MRRRLEKPTTSDFLPDVAGSLATDERVSNGPAHPRHVAWGPTTASPAPRYLFTSPVAPARGGPDTIRSLGLRDKKKLRCIWLAPDEGDQQIVRPPPLDSMQYTQISASMFGNNVMEKIKRADNLSVQLERSSRFMDAMHTYEQAAKMLLRCIQKREEALGVMMDDTKWLRIDYEIRCVQLVALCMCGARKTAAARDNTAFLLLKKAEELTARDGLQYCKKHVQRAAVYQNVANYYKKQKKYQAALQAAEKAVRINDKLAPSDRFPIAYFLQACLHGLVEEPAKAGFMYTACLTVAESQRSANENLQAAEVFYTLKASVLHNLAIEWANLNMPDQTRDALASAMEIGVHYLAQTHPVVVRILETYKVMRENFLFHTSSKNATAPVTTPQFSTRPPAPVRPTSPPLGNTKRPLPPTSQKASHESPGDLLSPRARRVFTHEAHYPESEDMSPMPPSSRRPTTPMSAARLSSPRARAIKRPTTSAEVLVPSKLSGQTLPPGATRTSHLRTVPDKIYSHSLGAKYNSHKERVLEEARSFGVRRRAALKIQKLWTKALMRIRVFKRKQNAAIRIQSTLRMHHEKAHYAQTLQIIRRVQAVWRGGLARTRNKMALVSVVQIQSAWRCRNERAKYAIKKIRVVLLQSVVRGFLARAVRSRKSKAAVKIQTQMRRYLCKKEFGKIVAAAARINRVLRGMQVRTRVENAVKCVVSGALEALVEAVVAEDVEVQAAKAAVERTVEKLVADVTLSEAEHGEQLERNADDVVLDVEGIKGDEDDKVLNNTSVEPTNDREGESKSFQVVDDGIKNSCCEVEGHEEIIPIIEALSTVDCPTELRAPFLLKSDSDRAILGAMMTSTISKFVDASIMAAIDDCSNDIQFAVDSGSQPLLNIVNEVSAAETTLEASDTSITIEDAVVNISLREREAEEASINNDAVMPDPEVEATLNGTVPNFINSANVCVENTTGIGNCAPSIVQKATTAEENEKVGAVKEDADEPAVVGPVVETASAVEAESVAVAAVEVVAAVEAVVEATVRAAEPAPVEPETPDEQETLAEADVPAETVEEEAAAPAKAEPAVDDEVCEVMAAVLSQVSIAPTEPTELVVVEPVVETASAVEAESVAVAAVEVVAAVEAVVEATVRAAEPAPVEPETPDEQETLAEADVPAETVEEEAAAPAKAEPAVDDEVCEVMAAVLSQVSIAPTEPTELVVVEPVVETASAVEAESVAVAAVEVVAAVEAVVEATVRAAEPAPVEPETPDEQETLAEADVPAETVEEEAAAPAKAEPAVDDEVCEVMAAVLSQVSIAPTEPTELVVVEPVVETASAVEAESVAVAAVEVVAAVEAVVEATVRAAEPAPVEPETPDEQETLAEADVPAETVEEEAAAPAKAEPAVDDEVCEVMAAVLSQVSIAPTEPTELVVVEPVVETASAVEAESVAVAAVEVVAAVEAVVEATVRAAEPAPVEPETPDEQETLAEADVPAETVEEEAAAPAKAEPAVDDEVCEVMAAVLSQVSIAPTEPTELVVVEPVVETASAVEAESVAVAAVEVVAAVEAVVEATVRAAEPAPVEPETPDEQETLAEADVPAETVEEEAAAPAKAEPAVDDEVCEVMAAVLSQVSIAPTEPTELVVVEPVVETASAVEAESVAVAAVEVVAAVEAVVEATVRAAEPAPVEPETPDEQETLAEADVPAETVEEEAAAPAKAEPAVDDEVCEVMAAVLSQVSIAPTEPTELVVVEPVVETASAVEAESVAVAAVEVVAAVEAVVEATVRAAEPAPVEPETPDEQETLAEADVPAETVEEEAAAPAKAEPAVDDEVCEVMAAVLSQVSIAPTEPTELVVVEPVVETASAVEAESVAVAAVEVVAAVEAVVEATVRAAEPAPVEPETPDEQETLAEADVPAETVEEEAAAPAKAEPAVDDEVCEVMAAVLSQVSIAPTEPTELVVVEPVVETASAVEAESVAVAAVEVVAAVEAVVEATVRAAEPAPVEPETPDEQETLAEADVPAETVEEEAAAPAKAEPAVDDEVCEVMAAVLSQVSIAPTEPTELVVVEPVVETASAVEAESVAVAAVEVVAAVEAVVEATVRAAEPAPVEPETPDEQETLAEADVPAETVEEEAAAPAKAEPAVDDEVCEVMAAVLSQVSIAPTEPTELVVVEPVVETASAVEAESVAVAAVEVVAAVEAVVEATVRAAEPAPVEPETPDEQETLAEADVPAETVEEEAAAPAKAEPAVDDEVCEVMAAVLSQVSIAPTEPTELVVVEPVVETASAVEAESVAVAAVEVVAAVEAVVEATVRAAEPAPVEPETPDEQETLAEADVPAETVEEEAAAPAKAEPAVDDEVCEVMAAVLSQVSIAPTEPTELVVVEPVVETASAVEAESVAVAAVEVVAAVEAVVEATVRAAEPAPVEPETPDEQETLAEADVPAETVEEEAAAPAKAEPAVDDEVCEVMAAVLSQVSIAPTEPTELVVVEPVVETASAVEAESVAVAAVEVVAAVEAVVEATVRAAEPAPVEPETPDEQETLAEADVPAETVEEEAAAPAKAEPAVDDEVCEVMAAVLSQVSIAPTEPTELVVVEPVVETASAVEAESVAVAAVEVVAAVEAVVEATVRAAEPAPVEPETPDEQETLAEADVPAETVEEEAAAPAKAEPAVDDEVCEVMAAVLSQVSIAPTEPTELVVVEPVVETASAVEAESVAVAAVEVVAAVEAVVEATVRAAEPAPVEPETPDEQETLAEADVPAETVEEEAAAPAKAEPAVDDEVCEVMAAVLSQVSIAPTEPTELVVVEPVVETASAVEAESVAVAAVEVVAAVEAVVEATVRAAEPAPVEPETLDEQETLAEADVPAETVEEEAAAPAKAEPAVDDEVCEVMAAVLSQVSIAPTEPTELVVVEPVVETASAVEAESVAVAAVEVVAAVEAVVEATVRAAEPAPVEPETPDEQETLAEADVPAETVEEEAAAPAKAEPAVDDEVCEVMAAVLSQVSIAPTEPTELVVVEPVVETASAVEAESVAVAAVEVVAAVEAVVEATVRAAEPAPVEPETPDEQETLAEADVPAETVEEEAAAPAKAEPAVDDEVCEVMAAVLSQVSIAPTEPTELVVVEPVVETASAVEAESVAVAAVEVVAAVEAVVEATVRAAEPAPVEPETPDEQETLAEADVPAETVEEEAAAPAKAEPAVDDEVCEVMAAVLSQVSIAPTEPTELVVVEPVVETASAVEAESVAVAAVEVVAAVEAVVEATVRAAEPAPVEPETLDEQETLAEADVPAETVEEEAAAPAKAEPAVDDEVCEVMAAVLSQVSIAPTEPTELVVVEPVVETASAVDAEVVLADLMAEMFVGGMFSQAEDAREDVCFLCGDCG